MKVRTNKESLLPVIQKAASAVERRQTMPILGNFLMSVEEGVLDVLATDLEMEVRARTRVQADGDMVFTLPARKLLDICKALPERAEITIEVDGEKAVIRSGSSRFHILLFPAADFPEMQMDLPEVWLDIEEGRLKQLLMGIGFSMGVQDVRYYLNGMLWEIGPKRLRAVATDGHRLALGEMELDTAEDWEEQELLVPRKTILELIRILDASKDQVRLEIAPRFIRVRKEGLILTSKLIDGRYPDYGRVIPWESPYKAIIDRSTLEHALQRVAILSNEKYRGVRMEFTRESVVAEASNPEQEKAEERIPCEFDGERLSIGFNVGYLLDVIHAIEGDKVEMQLRDSESSSLVKELNGEGFIYVVMPMRL